jgi:hypothetical protein
MCANGQKDEKCQQDSFEKGGFWAERSEVLAEMFQTKVKALALLDILTQDGLLSGFYLCTS